MALTTGTSLRGQTTHRRAARRNSQGLESPSRESALSVDAGIDRTQSADGSVVRIASPVTGGGEARDQSEVVTSRRLARGTWSRGYVNKLFVTDVIALVWASLGVHLIELPDIPTAVSSTPSYLPFIAATVMLALGWLVALSWSGSRDVKIVGHGPVEYKRIIQASLSLFGLVAIGSYLFQLDLPRSYLLIMLPAGLAALLASGWSVRSSPAFASAMIRSRRVPRIAGSITTLR
jgi:hypothetical protein